MKKILSLLVILGMYLNTTAQQVELMGIAMHNQPDGTIAVVDDPNLVDVTLFAIYLYSNGDNPTELVNFWDNTPENVDAPFIPIPVSENYAYPRIFSGVGYYTAVFDNDVDGSGENIIVPPSIQAHTDAFYAFVKRDDPNANYYSVYDYTQTHHWANGPGDAHTYDLNLLDNGLNRNVTITMPFSGMENNEANPNRVAVVEVEVDGSIILSEEFTGNSIGDYFHIYTSPEFVVPAAFTEISVRVYSPSEAWGNGDTRPMGDSFMCGGVIADVTQDDPGCTLTQGYWKTHSKGKKYDATWAAVGGPNADFFDSGQSYIGVLNTPVRGNAYYILAHQYIAAELNFYNGANPSAAFTAFTTATALFETYSPADIKNLSGDDPLRQQFVNLGGILTDYNEGTIGPGHCDDKSTYAEIETSTGSEMNIYPNPMTNSGTIDFTVENEAQTTVEMFNVMGQKVATLFDNPAQMGQQYQLNIDANRYQKGLYIVYLKNGSSTTTKKININ